MSKKSTKNKKNISGSKNSKPIYVSEKIKRRKINKSKNIDFESEFSESESEKISNKYAHKKKSKSDFESEFSESYSENNLIEEYNNDDLRNIIYENINDEYSIGKLGDFDVIFMRKYGYVNATNLCKSVKKEFYHWKENKHTKELFKGLKSSPGMSREPLILKNMKGEYMTRGTYVHPELIIHVACWCSIEYALKVSKIMIQYHAKEEIEKRELLLKKKDDKIDKLSKKLDRQNNKIDELLQKNEKMDNRIKRLVKKNDEIYNINQDMLGKIDVISNDRVVKGKTSDDHMFVIVKNNDDPDEYEDDEELYEYSAFRLMKKSYKIRMSEHLERHPNMEIILKICHSPNSMNLWNRIKTKLGKKKIIYSGCNFNLEDDYTENKLVRDIKRIHNERLDTDDI
ncbi:putative KilA-N domain-containing protein [Moumouvirus australiensis]|uniref:Putative KilA-N domain-containing protein n=1 Tax=Moumouvirus australiensis TaxID=2109587 RepID=A0A2P1EKS2_9VIRU|nr:putative KilA-N domain-containing protein [Moumouvirus australiensis]AVL94489.1 putative KilA-N domain-containing protein [Moumouvirus australiensis]